MKNSLVLLLFFLLPFVAVTGCSRDQLNNNRTYTVGVVNLNEELDKIFLGFKNNLEKLGYQEGRDITYIYNGSRIDTSEVENDLKFLIDQKVDMILSITTPATKKAKEMTANTGIPVVFAPVFSPVESGIVQSLVRPGSNMTGIKVGGNSEKALEWLLKVVPGTKKVLVPFSNNNKATVQSLMELKEGAEKLNIQLSVEEVGTREELTRVLENIPGDMDALWLLNSHFLVEHTALFVAASIKHKLPLGSSTSQVDDGVLVTYGQDAFRTGEMAADLAHGILQGRSPDSLPVEVTDFFLGINLKTANAIGIDISDDILHVADTIIRP